MENIDPKLKEFLIKEGVLDKFISNKNAAIGMDKYRYCDDIDRSFWWDGTPEGYIFWRKLDYKYKEIKRLQS